MYVYTANMLVLIKVNKYIYISRMMMVVVDVVVEMVMLTMVILEKI